MVNDISHIIENLYLMDQHKLDFIKIFSKYNQNKVDNKGIIFFKPEICQISPKKISLILEYFLYMTKIYSIELQSGYLLSGSFLKKNKLIERNYQMIRKYSVLRLTKRDKDNFLWKILEKEFGNFEKVYGGLSLWQDGYSSEFLMNLWTQSESAIKIQDDLYSISCTFNNEKIILVNGSFPYQLEQYEQQNSKIIFFTFKTTTSFKILKKYFQGSADSDQRYQHSIRQYLFDYRKEYLLGNITASRNGMHLSGNEEEGQNEVKIFMESLDIN